MPRRNQKLLEGGSRGDAGSRDVRRRAFVGALLTAGGISVAGCAGGSEGDGGDGSGSGSGGSDSIGSVESVEVVVEYDAPWRGHFGSKNDDGEDVVVSIEGDGQSDAKFGTQEQGSYSLQMPDDLSIVDSIAAPVIATATPTGEGTLDLELLVNGQSVGTDSSSDGEARVEYRPNARHEPESDGRL